MAITVKHTKVSTVPDGDDSSLIRPSDWNDDHQLTGTVPVANGGTGAATLTGYVKGNGTANMTAASTIPSTDVTGLGTMSTQNSNNISVTGGSISGTTVSGYIPTTEKAAALGVATLDAGGTVPLSQIPASIQGGVSYQGTWNASTNTPTLSNGVGTKGYYYVVSVAGNTNLDGITSWNVGDWAIFNGTVWQKVDNTDAVTSVNGYTGTVVLTTTDVAEGTNQYFTTARSRTSVSAGTGISYDSGTGVITNSSPSLGGDVVGPASATDNAIARFDSTTGKLLQNSVVTVGDTGATTGITTLSASTSVTTPIVQASNSGGLALKNSAGTTQISMGAGGGDNVSINVATNINGANAQIDISPTGTGHVHMKPTGTGSIEIAPTNVGTMDNMTIGATTARAITGTTITATSFVGSGASLTNVVNSLAASTGISVSGSTGAVTVTNTAPDQTVVLTAGTGISTSGTYPNFTITNTAPSSGATYTRTSFTATASQTTFTVSYTVGLIQVYVNGVLLNGADYTASNGTSVVLAVACNAGDIVETLAFDSFSVASTVSSFSAGTTGLTPNTGTTGNVTLGGTLAVANGGTGVTTSTGSGAVVLGTSPTISGAVLSSMASSVITSGTAQASTSGTSIDFTGIPSWVKRITVMFNGVSASGTALVIVQIGSTTFTTSGYLSSGSQSGGSNQVTGLSATTGFLTTAGGNASNIATGATTLTNITGNTWISSASMGFTNTTFGGVAGGTVAISGVLDRVRITTVGGTNTFDAGSINILYE